MKTRFKHITLIALSAFSLFTACKKWEDHNAITDPAITLNVYEQIKANPELSRFAELLKSSGYDAVISSPKLYTVFAPVNAALASLDPGLVSDTARLKRFVSNHIAPQSYFFSSVSGKTRVPMINGKYNNLFPGGIEDAGIVKADQYAKNGVVHMIDKSVPYLDNIWETMTKSTTLPQAEKLYLLSLFRKVFDSANAVQIGVDPNTGRPIYQPGTDSVFTNVFWRNVYDLRDEENEYSFIMLADAAWNSEQTKFRPFHVTSTTDSTTSLTNWTVVKDLAVMNVYTNATLPDTLVSKFGVKVPVDKSAIQQTIKTSNGNIYVMSRADVQPRDKILPFVIQGENYRTTSVNRRNNTFFRDRFNIVTQRDFQDVLVYNHGVALFNMGYQVPEVYSTRYRAFWVAVNDFQTAAFTQRLAIGGALATTFPYTNVPANNYNEVLIGEFTQASFRPILDVFLTAANTTTATANAIVCDYIRLEPVF